MQIEAIKAGNKTMDEATRYFEFRRLLAAYCSEADYPCSIQEMLSWATRTDKARDAARQSLGNLISSPGELRCLYDLCRDLISDQLDAEKEQEFLCHEE